MRSRNLKGLVLLAATSAVAVTACSSSDANNASVGVTAQLISITPSASLHSLKSKNGILATSVGAMAENNNEDDVFIDSYKIVLSDIAISTGTELTGAYSDVVYQCTENTDQACLVDLAEEGAVDGLLDASTFKIRPGDYTFAMIGTCVESRNGGTDQGSYIRVKARIRSDGNWYYTTAAAGDTEFFLNAHGAVAPPSRT